MSDVIVGMKGVLQAVEYAEKVHIHRVRSCESMDSRGNLTKVIQATCKEILELVVENHSQYESQEEWSRYALNLTPWYCTYRRG